MPNVSLESRKVCEGSGNRGDRGGGRGISATEVCGICRISLMGGLG